MGAKATSTQAFDRGHVIFRECIICAKLYITIAVPDWFKINRTYFTYSWFDGLLAKVNSSIEFFVDISTLIFVRIFSVGVIWMQCFYFFTKYLPAILTLTILRFMVPTPYTRGGGGGIEPPCVISRTLTFRDLKFCRLLAVLFKLSENVK